MSTWTAEIDDLLERLRVNSVNLSEYHRRRYYEYKSYGKWFRIPIIVLSIFSTFSVGLTQFGISQLMVSGIVSIVGAIISMVSAVELYLNIHKAMDDELLQSKDYYSLAIEIYKTLRLPPVDRGSDGKEYLNKQYAKYQKFRETSDLMNRKMKHDALAKIPHKYQLGPPPTPSRGGTPSSTDDDEDPYATFPKNYSVQIGGFFQNSGNKDFSEVKLSDV